MLFIIFCSLLYVFTSRPGTLRGYQSHCALGEGNPYLGISGCEGNELN